MQLGVRFPIEKRLEVFGRVEIRGHPYHRRGVCFGTLKAPFYSKASTAKQWSINSLRKL